MPKDADAIARMYRRLEAPLFRKCLTLLHDDELARDAAQEVFVKLSAAATQLREPDAELAWALKAAHNHCLNVLRSRERRAAREADPPGDRVAVSPVTDRQLGRAVLAGLSETSQALVIGSLVEDEDQAELARRHGVSKKTVARKVKRAVERARTLIKKDRGGR